jgi:hypothetical protein
MIACWRESLKTQETLAQDDDTTTSGPATDTLIAPSMAQMSQPGSYQAAGLPVNESFAGLEMENFDLFNSMDWMLGNWPDMPLAPYDMGSQINPP